MKHPATLALSIKNASLGERAAGHPQWVGAGIVALVLLGLSVLVNPIHNFPVSDDWEYARTVQILLTRGEFYRSPLVQATALFPAVWGALFSLPFGFSFVALRLSTFPLALGAGLSFYALLGELQFDPLRRTLGTLTLMVGPLFVFYTNSFMTDIPFLCWLLLGLWGAVRGFRQNRVAFIGLASVCAVFAFCSRQLGLALPIGMAGAVLLARPRSEWGRWLGAALLVPVAAVTAFYLWQALEHQTTWADASITSRGTLEFLFSGDAPLAMARRVVDLVLTGSLYALPLYAAALPALPKLWRVLGTLSRARQILIAGSAVFIFGTVFYLGARGEWWTYHLDSLTPSGLRPFLAHFAWPNDRRLPFFPTPLWNVLSPVGAAAGVMLVAGLAVNFQREAVNASPRIVVALVFTTLAGAILIFPLFFERYMLTLLPGAIILVLYATRRVQVALVPAVVALVVIGAFSVGLLWDYWGWHAAVWTAAENLQAQGVPREKLDGGYEWDGWNLSDEAYAAIRTRNLPMTNNPWQYVIDPEYMMTFTPQAGYQTFQEIPFASPFRAGGQDKVLLLKREDRQ